MTTKFIELAEHRKISPPKQEYDFLLLGISSLLKDYHVAWEINKLLKIDFTKKEYSLSQNKEFVDKNIISYYEYKDTDNLFRLFFNKVTLTNMDFLIPEMKSLDYILFISGPEKEKFSENLVNDWKNTKTIKGIALIKKLNPSKLKTAQNILW